MCCFKSHWTLAIITGPITNVTLLAARDYHLCLSIMDSKFSLLLRTTCSGSKSYVGESGWGLPLYLLEIWGALSGFTSYQLGRIRQSNQGRSPDREGGSGAGEPDIDYTLASGLWISLPQGSYPWSWKFSSIPLMLSSNPVLSLEALPHF